MSDTKEHSNCPNCGCKLTMQQIITLMHGSGFAEYVRVKTTEGTVVLVEAGLVNPVLVEVLD